jgi:ribonuclease-3
MKLEQLAQALAYEFRTPNLLQRALTHRSFGADNNERFEFLGDSVLNCIIAEALFVRYGELSEGALSRLRANIVRQNTLATVARKMELGHYLWLGEGERKSGGAARASILADALEAIIGAIHVDGGFDQARTVTLSLFADVLSSIDPTLSSKDSKTTLQEILQGRKLDLPVYELVATRGEAHAQEFDVDCLIPVLSIRCSGTGNSRRAAEQAAAAKAIEVIES